MNTNESSMVAIHTMKLTEKTWWHQYKTDVILAFMDIHEEKYMLTPNQKLKLHPVNNQFEDS